MGAILGARPAQVDPPGGSDPAQPAATLGIMPSVAAGSRLLMRTAAGFVVLRALGESGLVGDWSIPVMGDVAALGAGAVPVEVPTDEGLLTLTARVSSEDGGLWLRPLPEVPPVHVQRRDTVRAGLQLPVRGAVTGGDLSRVADLVEDLEIDFEGLTRDVSGGGMGIDFVASDPPLPAVREGARLYVEIDLPHGVAVMALLDVVTARRGFLRGAFADISSAHRNALVGLVFARQRLDLARRRY